MLLKLFLAFTLIPIIELYLLIEVGTIIGALNTVIIVIATGFAGAWLARLQGMQTMSRGIVLLTPGFITDAAGLLLLIPETRNYFKRFLRYKFDRWIQNQNVHIQRKY
jgi:UPF0716 protein FxsA